MLTENIHSWEQPVQVELNGTTHDVLTPAQARNILLIEWPGEHTGLHKAASQACLAAMEGADPQTAWSAFVEAAAEAGILVG